MCPDMQSAVHAHKSEEFSHVQCAESTVWAIFQLPSPCIVFFSYRILCAAQCKQSIATKISIYTIRPKCWAAIFAYNSAGHGNTITISLMLLFSVNKIQHRAMNQQFRILSLFTGAMTGFTACVCVCRVSTEYPLVLDASYLWYCWSRSTDLHIGERASAKWRIVTDFVIFNQ